MAKKSNSAVATERQKYTETAARSDSMHAPLKD